MASEYVPIADLRGPEGKPGVQGLPGGPGPKGDMGLPGINGATTDAGVAALFGTSSATKAQATLALNDPGYDIFVLVGQSNMRGNNTEWSSFLDPINSKIDQYGATDRVIAPASEPLDMRIDKIGIGPGLQFARHYAAKTMSRNRKVLLIPAAQGGTYLSTDVGQSWRSTRPDSLWKFSVLQTQEAIAAAVAGWAGTTAANHRVVGILWAQGEADGSGSIPAATYKADLIALISNYRTVFNDQTIPFVISPLVPEFLGNGTSFEINQAQSQIPNEIPRTGWAMPPTGMQSQTDPVHWPAPAQRLLGRRVYDEFIRITGGVAPVNPVAAVPNWLTAIADPFTRADGAVGNTPTGGLALSPVGAATVAIASNRLKFTAWAGSSAFALYNMPTADGRFQVTMTDKGALESWGIVFRYVDATSYYALTIGPDHTYRIRRRTGTTWALSAQTTTVANNGDVIRLEVVGPNIKLTVNGTVIATSLAFTVNMSSTKFGYYAAAASTDLQASWDDMSFAPPFTATAPSTAGWSLVAADDFNRADGAVGTTPTGGVALAAVSPAVLQIVANTLKFTTAASSRSFGLYTMPAADARYTMKVTSLGAAKGAGLIFRYLSDTSYYVVNVNPADGTWRVQRRNGSSNAAAGTTSVVAVDGDVVTVEIVGTTLHLSINGALVLNSSAFTVNITSTIFGVYTTTDTAAAFDEMTFEIPAT